MFHTISLPKNQLPKYNSNVHTSKLLSASFYNPQPTPFLCVCTSQYIWLIWWTVPSTKQISFRECGSHGDHYIGAAWPSALNINQAWLTDTDIETRDRENAKEWTHVLSTLILVGSALFYGYVTEFNLLPWHESWEALAISLLSM